MVYITNTTLYLYCYYTKLYNYCLMVAISCAPHTVLRVILLNRHNKPCSSYYGFLHFYGQGKSAIECEGKTVHNCISSNDLNPGNMV